MVDGTPIIWLTMTNNSSCGDIKQENRLVMVDDHIKGPLMVDIGKSFDNND